MKTPQFWYQKSVKSKLLAPLGKVYAWSVSRRFKKTRPYQSSVPVICVGNISVGGTGKTPVCLALGKILDQFGTSFFFLNHGYKAKLKGVLVDEHEHTALDVGDEALLLAQMAPTVVDNQRARGAQIAVREGAKAIIMDDGFQNPSLIKTISLVVVDGRRGFGNGHVLPAGPLREPIDRGLNRADGVIIVGEDKAGIRKIVQQKNPDLPILSGCFQPNKDVLSVIKGQSVMAFAGIGDPQKFFDMLDREGICVDHNMAFPDHYFYTRFDIEQIMSEAGNLPIVTTSKDFVKIPRDLQKNVICVSGDFVFDKESQKEIGSMLGGVLSAYDHLNQTEENQVEQNQKYLYAMMPKQEESMDLKTSGLLNTQKESQDTEENKGGNDIGGIHQGTELTNQQEINTSAMTRESLQGEMSEDMIKRKEDESDE